MNENKKTTDVERNLRGAFSVKMSELKSQGRINSYYRYQSTLRAIECFGNPVIMLSDLSPAILSALETAWRKDGKSQTTIAIYMKTLRCILQEAFDAQEIDSLPFGKNKYRIPVASGRKLALSTAQLKAIIEWKGASESEMWRDLWLFSYLCNGICFKDMLLLKYSSIVGSEICYMRSKTMHSHPKEIRAYLSDPLKDIIARWGNRTIKGGIYIFPFLSGGESPMVIEMKVRRAVYTCNAHLAVISKELGIPRFTTYSARHSFATTLMRRGVDIYYISQSLGHTSIKTTEAYLASFESDDRRKYSALLTDF